MKRSYVLSSIVFLSSLIFIFLTWFIYFKAHSISNNPLISQLPLLNCFLNALSAICLILGIKSIKSGQQDIHKRWMFSALGFSALFLISYLVYHHFHGDTLFAGQGLIRPIYFFTLISHIVLTLFGLPFILTTFYFALSSQLQSHKKIARWTFPVWLYISVTGVLIYVFQVLFS